MAGRPLRRARNNPAETPPQRRASLNRLTPHLVEAIAMYIASTEDPDEITDGLEAALHAGGMSDRDIARAVERFLPDPDRRFGA